MGDSNSAVTVYVPRLTRSSSVETVSCVVACPAGKVAATWEVAFLGAVSITWSSTVSSSEVLRLRVRLNTTSLPSFTAAAAASMLTMGSSSLIITTALRVV